MRPLRRITAEEEGFRIEEKCGWGVIRRNPVEPEPIGTIVLLAWRIVGYDRDCDGSLMARLEMVSRYEDGLDYDGPTLDCMGLYPCSAIVVTEEELLPLLEDHP